MGHRVAAVGRIQEEHARFTVVVCVFDDLVEDFAGPHSAPYLAILRVDQVKVRILLHSLHESIGDSHRDVEVTDVSLGRLATDELQYVGVVHAQHGHVGTPS